MKCCNCEEPTTYLVSIEIDGTYRVVEQPICIECFDGALGLIHWLGLQCEIDIYEPINERGQ